MYTGIAVKNDLFINGLKFSTNYTFLEATTNRVVIKTTIITHKRNPLYLIIFIILVVLIIGVIIYLIKRKAK